jgi:hypothetical protein
MNDVLSEIEINGYNENKMLAYKHTLIWMEKLINLVSNKT